MIVDESALPGELCVSARCDDGAVMYRVHRAYKKPVLMESTSARANSKRDLLRAMKEV